MKNNILPRKIFVLQGWFLIFYLSLRIHYSGRTQLKKMNFFLNSRVEVVLYVNEGDEFTYRCLISRNDGPARQSRNESPLFPKNIPSCIQAFHNEGEVFSTCGFFHMIEEGLKGTPFKFRHKIFTTSGRKKFMKIK